MIARWQKNYLAIHNNESHSDNRRGLLELGLPSIQGEGHNEKRHETYAQNILLDRVKNFILNRGEYLKKSLSSLLTPFTKDAVQISTEAFGQKDSVEQFHVFLQPYVAAVYIEGIPSSGKRSLTLKTLIKFENANVFF